MVIVKINAFRAIMLAILIVIVIPIVLLVISSLWNKSSDYFEGKDYLKSYYNTFSGNVTYCDISLSRYENNVLTPYKTLRIKDINIQEFADFLDAARSFDSISSVDYIKQKSINIFINVVEDNKTSQISFYVSLENEEMYLPEPKCTLKIKKEYIDYLKRILL